MSQPIRLASAPHCCACNVVCHHIGPMQLCDAHRTPSTPTREDKRREP